jgi:hypothetical protein
MGYRELLKKYIRFLEMTAGDNYIELIPGARERILSDRDLGELRTIAAEIFREAHGDPQRARVDNANYRFRMALNRYGISVSRAAALAGVDEERVRGWRTHPRSRRYLEMSSAEYARFETALEAWLEEGGEASRSG